MPDCLRCYLHILAIRMLTFGCEYQDDKTSFEVTPLKLGFAKTNRFLTRLEIWIQRFQYLW